MHIIISKSSILSYMVYLCNFVVVCRVDLDELTCHVAPIVPCCTKIVSFHLGKMWVVLALQEALMCLRNKLIPIHAASCFKQFNTSSILSF
jgi:hypothetical protein